MDKKGLKDILIYIQKEINETNNVLVNIEQLKLVILCFKKHNVELVPLICGSQEQGLFAGTENVLGVLSLGKAIDLLKYIYGSISPS